MTSEGSSGSGMPRVLKIVAVVAAVSVLVLVGVLAVGAANDDAGGHQMGNHGPGSGTMNHGSNHTSRGGSHHGATDNHPTERRGPAMWTIELEDNTFHADNLTIQRGDTVRWVHAGSNPHTVTADNRSFDSHPDCNILVDGPLGRCMANGANYTRTFDAAEKVSYGCKLHQAMVGTVHVLESYGRTPDTNHH